MARLSLAGSNFESRLALGGCGGGGAEAKTWAIIRAPMMAREASRGSHHA